MCNLNKLDLKTFQKTLVVAFRQMLDLGEDDVKKEWSSMLVERELQIYSPRIDVAVGPFSEIRSYIDTYDEFMRREDIRNFVELLITYHRYNIDRLGINDNLNGNVEYGQLSNMNINARCLMAVEIENKVSRKHLMGGAINASALGRIGVVLPWTEDNLRAFARMIRYMAYLKEAEKNTFNTSNILIVTKEQLITAIEENSNVIINDIINGL